MIPYGIARYIITKSELEEFKIKIWNEAIEAASLCKRVDIFASVEIRSLKK